MGISRTGDIQIISPPSSVRNNQLTSNNTIFAFAEQTNFSLITGLELDIISEGTYNTNNPPSSFSNFLPAGIRINSYFVHFDSNTNGPNGNREVRGAVTVSNNERILGLIVDGNAALHNANGAGTTGNRLGLFSTTYRDTIGGPNTNSNHIDRGDLEFSGGILRDRVEWSGQTINFTFRVEERRSDQVRIITETLTAPTLTSFTLNGSNRDISVPEGTSVVNAQLHATDTNFQASVTFLLIDDNSIGRSLGTDSSSPFTSSTLNLGPFPNNKPGNAPFIYQGFARDNDNSDSEIVVRRVFVFNVDPTITSISAPSTIFEGQSALTTVTATDPGTDSVQFLLNGQNIGTDSRTSGTRSRSGSTSTYTDNGQFSIVAQAIDQDGGSDTVSRTITVLNVDPTITGISAPSTINEGEAAFVTISATDPGADSIQFSLNGQNLGTDSRTSGTRSGSGFTQVFADEGVFTIQGVATDDDNGTDTQTTTVQVLNVDPTLVSLTQDLRVEVNEVFNFSAQATDPGINDVLSYNWDLDGDGQFDDFNGASGQFSFTSPGLQEIKVRVDDGDGGTDEGSFFVNVITKVNGTSGLDILTGTATDDEINGGLAGDIITGNGGNDRFIYESLSDGGDIITDFSPGDIFDFSELLISSGASVNDVGFQGLGNNTLITVQNIPFLLVQNVTSDIVDNADNFIFS
ncbi:MAG: PKD domain-containing protein [Crocosphaera sp.]